VKLLAIRLLDKKKKNYTHIEIALISIKQKEMKKKKKNSNQKISKKPERLRWLKVETEHQNMLRQFSVLNN
jgi:hypothetical protein